MSDPSRLTDEQRAEAGHEAARQVAATLHSRRTAGSRNPTHRAPADRDS